MVDLGFLLMTIFYFFNNGKFQNRDYPFIYAKGKGRTQLK
jgi:hypothetical protein